MSYKLSHLAPCFYHEDAVLSDSAHSASAAADVVVPVALHRSWVRLDSEALVRWSSEIQQDLIWWWAHEQLELVMVRLFICQLGSRLNPFRGSEWTLPLSGFQRFGEGGRCPSSCS